MSALTHGMDPMGREGFEHPCKSDSFVLRGGTGGGTFCSHADIPDALWRA